MDADAAEHLLRAILADLPRLPGAACVSQYALFDDVPGCQSRDQRAERFEAAVRVCESCPARPACPESLPDPAAGRMVSPLMTPPVVISRAVGDGGDVAHEPDLSPV